jgi:hypothetical protein
MGGFAIEAGGGENTAGTGGLAAAGGTFGPADGQRRENRAANASQTAPSATTVRAAMRGLEKSSARTEAINLPL